MRWDAVHVMGDRHGDRHDLQARLQGTGGSFSQSSGEAQSSQRELVMVNVNNRKPSKPSTVTHQAGSREGQVPQPQMQHHKVLQ
jgi:hypothetical protein